MSYNCPGCNNIMEEEDCGIDLPPNYVCGECEIIYLKRNDSEIHLSDIVVKNNVLCKGTFDYCCRIYKLKCFT